MIKTYLILFFLIASAHSIFAQGQERESFSASVSVSATVLQTSIELITVNSMTFDRLQPGQRQVSINPVTNANAGHMIAIGVADTPFRLSFLPERELTNTQGGRSLTFFYQVAGGTADEQAASELLEADNREIRFNEEGNFYLWIGGSVNLQNADPGSYEGDFSIEIDYI